MLQLLALLSTAHADIAPSPTRPQWDDPEAPLPDPPADVEVALALALAAAALAAGSIASRRNSTPATSRPAQS